LLVAASVVHSSSILVTLTKEALGSSETSVLTRAARRNIPEDTILHSHRRETTQILQKNYGFNKTTMLTQTGHIDRNIVILKKLLTGNDFLKLLCAGLLNQ
jgi:hypothetical protein